MHTPPEQLRAMADACMSRSAMAEQLGIHVNRVNRMLRAHGIKTNAPRGGDHSIKTVETWPVGGLAASSAGLMPSPRAIALSSPFRMGAA